MLTARMALVALAFLVASAPSAGGTSLPPLFNTVEFRAPSLAALPQWERVLRRIEKERPTYQACIRDLEACPTRAVLAWQAMIKSQIGRAPIEQVRAVNLFLNDWQYKPDVQNYGRRDYWATPLEFLRRSGDCEDYAIAKYVSLRQIGFAPEQLRVVVVRDVVRELAHAVLAVYLDDGVYILDNLSRVVVRQRELAHYVPYYSINETTRWAHVPPRNTLVSAVGNQPSVPSAEGARPIAPAK